MTVLKKVLPFSPWRPVWVVGVAVLLVLVGRQGVVAQGVVVLRTGGGTPLVTASESVLVPPGAGPVPLMFDFGFGTDETVAPGRILDSFTVTVQDAAGVHTLVLLTADAGGLVWAPFTPGAMFISPDAIVRTPVAFPSLEPVLVHQIAFAVTVPLPPAFSGLLHVHFDLFDNLDSTASLGWFRAVQVPEPASAALLITGSAFFIWLRRRQWPKPGD
jgi:hypothetical protein